MTAQMETFKSESNSATDLIGQNWQKLIDLIESRPDDSEAKSFDGGGAQRPLHTDDNFLRALQDVKRLRQKDMPLFGHCPETDAFYTVVCSNCSMILMPHALKDHYDKRHGDSEKNFAATDKQVSDPQIKSKSKKVTPVKLDKSEKPKKTKSGSGSEMTDEALKDQKRSEKSKKVKTQDRTTPSEAESAPANTSQTTKTEKLKHKNGSGPRFESQPNVPLSPVLFSENAPESNDEKDLPKKKQRDKKKNERKTDKVFDPDKHCGVLNEEGKPCVRSLFCKVHQVALKRAVPNRSMTYDMLIRVMKMQGEDEKVKLEYGLYESKVVESYEKEARTQQPIEDIDTSLKLWESELFEFEEPPIKRLKIKKEVDTIEEEIEESQFILPSHLEALIDETLRSLKEAEEDESFVPMLPLSPKPEPVLKWTSEIVSPLLEDPPSPSHVLLDDLFWHSSHPKPLATNTFGCRLIGGLMSTCKKLETLRKHLQSVWTSSNPASSSMNSRFNNACSPGNKQNGCATDLNMKNSFIYSQYVKVPSVQSKAAPLVTKTVPSPTMKGNSTKRKRKTSTNAVVPAQNTSNASDIISGLLISNSVPVQRTTAATVPAIQSGVIPVNSITGNGVPLRLFQGSLPVIASTTPNQSATFIQFNLCPK